MSDIVEQLRCAPDFDQPDIAELYEDAAREIERLRAVLKEISEEGDVIRDNGEIKKMALSASGHLSCRRMAHRALSQSGYGG